MDAVGSIVSTMSEDEREKMGYTRFDPCSSSNIFRKMRCLAELAAKCRCFSGFTSVVALLGNVSVSDVEDEWNWDFIRSSNNIHLDDSDDSDDSEKEDPDEDFSSRDTSEAELLKLLEPDAQTRARANTTLAQLANGDLGDVISSCYDSHGKVKEDAVSQALHIYCVRNCIYPGMFPAKASRKRKR